MRAVMRANRSRDTRPELRVRRAAHALGLRYRVAARPLPQQRLTADLVFTRARVAVFVDGCFWHGCPEHYRPATANSEFWQRKISSNQVRDERANHLLEAAGWVSLRFWEHDDPQQAAVVIERTVRSRSISRKG
ncbi:very short patch repair endonuclease [Georgenia soli]|uniref:very short patch repair endonuclease n=1 Tax=Georgenia soli TaxID=638953 RepID=UPI001FE89550|nr:very short patch repair endonuclease [Georgenia soli]